MSNLLEHAADLAVAAFNQRDGVPRVFLVNGEFDARRLRAHTEAAAFHAGLLRSASAGHARLRRQHNSVTQFLNVLFRRLSADLHLVGLRNVRAGLRQLRHQVAVVGHQQQTFAHVIQSANGEDAFLHARDQFHDRGATFGIAHRGDVSFGLINHQIDVALGAAQKLAIKADFVGTRVGFRAEFGDDLAVHRNAAASNQFFGFAPGRNSSSRKYLL